MPVSRALRRAALLAGLSAGLSAAALCLAPAAAQADAVYPPGGGNSITVDTTAPVVGGTVTVSAQTYLPGHAIEVTTATEAGSGVTSQAAVGGGRAATAAVASAPACRTGSTCTVVAPSSGVVSATVTLTESGRTTVTVRGTGSDGNTLTQTVALNVVTVGKASTVATLPQTGANVLQTALVGAAMLGSGLLLVLAVRRRRDAVLPV